VAIWRQDGLRYQIVLFFVVNPTLGLPLVSPTWTSPKSSSASRSVIWFY